MDILQQIWISFVAIIVIIIFIFIKIIVAITKRRLHSPSNKVSIPDGNRRQYPYEKKEYLLTIAEKNFFDLLLSIGKENNFLIFPKVRLEDLLYLPAGTEQRLKWRGYVRSRHADFVICDSVCHPLAIIELDDSSHYGDSRHEIDARINQIFREANLPMFRFKVHSQYDESSIRGVLNSLK